MATTAELDFLARRLAAQKKKHNQDVAIGLDILAAEIGGFVRNLYLSLQTEELKRLANLVTPKAEQDLGPEKAKTFVPASTEVAKDENKQGKLTDVEISIMAKGLAKEIKDLHDIHSKELTDLLTSDEPTLAAKQKAIPANAPLFDSAKSIFAAINAAKKPVETTPEVGLLFDVYDEDYTTYAANMMSFEPKPKVAPVQVADLLFRQKLDILDRIEHSLPVTLSSLDKSLVKTQAVLELLTLLRNANSNTENPSTPFYDAALQISKAKPDYSRAPAPRFGGSAKANEAEEEPYGLGTPRANPKFTPQPFGKNKGS